MNDLFDVSLVLALHREGALLRRTLLSLREAAQQAHAEGITVELVATLDRSDAATRLALNEFGVDGFDGRTVREVDRGSLGLSRNDGVGMARGRYIGICDGDDLVSFDSISAMFRLLESVGPGHIAFPEYLYAFGSRYHCWKYLPLDVVTPLAFVDTHPYISRAFAPRSVFQVVPYADASLLSGYAYEDWHFNAECIARGYRIIVAKNTILFYRQRPDSLLTQAHARSSRQIPPCSLFEPTTWVSITHEAYERLAPFGDVRADAPDMTGWGAVLDSAGHRAFLRSANAIDPAIHPESLKSSSFADNLGARGVVAGLAYHEICQVIGTQRFDDVFLLPFIATGGAERYVGDVLQALYEMRPEARILIILGELHRDGSRVDRVPPNATVLDLAGDWPHLAMDQRQLLTLKLIQSVAPLARLHLRPSPFAHAFYREFKTVLRSNPAVLYRFCDLGELTRWGAVIDGWAFDFVSENAPDLALIVTDNQAIIERDRERIGIYPEKW